MAVLGDGEPRGHRDLVRETGLSDYAVWSVLARCWKRGLVLRTKEPLRKFERVFKGRAGTSGHLRTHHLYVLRPEGVDRLGIDGHEFVKFDRKHLDVRGGGRLSKAQKILNFLKSNSDRAWFSTEVAEALKKEGVKVRDVMSNVRRFERRGLVYVRGYRSHDRQTPFKEGYLLTWIDPQKPREQAVGEAVERTNRALANKASTSPIIERVHQIRDMVIEAAKLRDLVGSDFLQNRLGCTMYEAEGAVTRALQLYPDIKEVKLFNAFKYLYHASMAEEDLKAAIALKENYIRMVKGRENRVGHNWEACVEWFIDRFTTGAVFQTQNHRTRGMDRRRITLYLLKGVGGRRQHAEVDRVWTVTPGVFAQPITYVLECKHGLVRKRDVDDFLNVLRWSKEFGVDTPDGRQVKQGVIGVFAGTAFNPREKVRLKDETEISLSSYASRMNIQLLKASDFNQRLHERGCPRAFTVQKICRIAKDENEVREVLDVVWENAKKGEEILVKVAEKNKELYEFERMLEKTQD